MKSSYGVFLFLFVFFLCTLTHAENAPVLPGTGPSIREVSLSQIFRYGREMYRYGNYPEAVRAFKQMIDIKCDDELAQYHLIKIARDVPEYSDLNMYLKNLPCQVHNFDEIDFLPASLFYESDPDLLREQLSFYNKRYRLAKDALEDSAKKCRDLTGELQDEIKSLRQQISDAGSAKTETEKRLKEPTGTCPCLTMPAMPARTRIADLQEEVQAQQERHQEALSSFKTEITSHPKPDSVAEVKSVPEVKNTPAVADPKIVETRAKLDEQARALDAKSRDLVSLQDKMNDIQERLRLIQAEIELKNKQIKTLQSDLNRLQR